MKILSLDLSLQETGFCKAENGKYNYGIIKTDRKDIERLYEIYIQINDMIDNFKPDIMAIEDYSYGSGRYSNYSFSAGELGGIIKLLALKKGLVIIIVPIPKWKKIVCGKGNLPKDQIMLYVYKKYGIEFNNNNMCDAFCITKYIEDIYKYGN